VLRHHAIAPLHQRKQHVERARAELGGCAIDQHTPLHRVNLERAAEVAIA
jgi:hypothetical protein